MRTIGLFTEYFLHFIIMYELYFIVKDPFKSLKSRINSYWIAAVIFNLFHVSYYLYFGSGSSITAGICTSMVTTMFLVMCVFLCLSIQVLVQQDTSPALRCSIISRTVGAMIFYFLKVAEIVVWAVRSFEYNAGTQHTFVNEHFNVEVKYVVGICSLILIAVRVSEPFIYAELKRVFTCSR